MDRYSLIKEAPPAYAKQYDDEDSSHSEDSLLEKATDFQYKKPAFYKRLPTAVLIHLLLALANVSFCFLFLSWTIDQYSHGPRLRFSPARSTVSYETRQFDMIPIYLPNGTANPEKVLKFNGPPSAELDAAWERLLRYQTIRLTKEELGERGSEEGIVALPDGGYFGTITAYHSLHCVKRLHHFMYRDTYSPGLSAEESMRLQQHAEHCLDTLRQNIQCGADTTVIPLKWGTFQRIPIGSDTGKHECANWEALDDWMGERVFEPMAPGYLTHPTLGAAYPDGKGTEIGIVVDKVLKDPNNS